MKKRKDGIWNKVKIVWPLAALFCIGFILYLERTGIVYKAVDAEQSTLKIKQEATAAVLQETDCLLVVQEENEISLQFAKQMEAVLSGMKVPYDRIDAAKLAETNLAGYNKMVFALTDLEAAGKGIEKISEWVEKGGVFMNTATFDLTHSFDLLAGKMGILEGGEGYRSINGFKVKEGFMIGGDNREFLFEEASNANIEVLLKPETQVYVQAADSNLPLLWTAEYGKGKFVITNQTLTGKVSRGLLAAAYSLTEEISVYPVINASAFYLDDFPAPVPSGNGTYIREEYGLDIANFYTNIWWEDMLSLEEIYGIKHTGMIIEDYSDTVEAPFQRTGSDERFTFYGNMLLNAGGELGFHGYNHMPLCLEGFDYKGLYDSYELWKDSEGMKASIQELFAFSSALFPEEDFSVYVPPSNILSAEGRQALLEAHPKLRAIASTYLAGDCIYEQEFEVAPDGIVETPRITSGTIMEEYSYLMAWSELNFHFVQSHFLHPDDVLDEDRGAAYGWETMKGEFTKYLDWIYKSAPGIKNVTGSGMADAVEIYDTLSVKRTETEEGMQIVLGGFTGEASLMVRINEKTLKEVKGGRAKPVTGNLYSITALSDTIEIITE